MNLSSYHEAYRESLAVFEALRKLGFDSKDIFFLVAETPTGELKQVAIVLRAQEKEFTAVTGILKGTVEEIQRTWAELAELLSTGKIPQDQLDKSWQKSMVFLHKTEFVLALTRKRFRFPCAAKKLQEFRESLN